MKSIKYLITLTLCLATSGLMAQREMPSLRLKTMKNEATNLENYTKEGKTTVIVFWTTWNSASKKALDNMVDHYDDWRDKYNAEVLAISLDSRRSLAKVLGTASSKGWKFTLLTAQQHEAFSAFNFNNPPQFYIIGRSGKIAWSHSGYVPGDEVTMNDKVAELAK